MTSLTFEKALTDLENIVSKLEAGSLSLNESLALFEKGVKLARFLREELDKAEKKVEILLKDEKGEMKTKPFDLDREEPSSSSAEEEDLTLTEKDEKGDEDLPF